MKMLFYTNFKFLLCLLFTLCLQNVNAQAQSLNADGPSTLTDESKEQIYAEQKNLEQKINLLLSGIREKLAVQSVRERFESGLSSQIYEKAAVKCPSIQLKRLMKSNSSFVLRQETTIEEATYFAELLQSLNVLLNQ
jgi:vacuolar-type H+-ATPase catalytic subunit A/Vma1